MRRGLVLVSTLAYVILIGGLAALLFDWPGAEERPIPPYLAPRGYVCSRAAEPLTIDGKLDEPSWQSAPWTDDFVDISGEQKPRPRFRTRAKMLWDDNYFYIGAELEEPHVQGFNTQHDAYIFHEDNDFEVFINPSGSSHAYCEIEMNARNAVWDLFLTRPYKDGGLPLDTWEIPGLKSAVHVEGTLNDPRDVDRGWTVELAIPWSVLVAFAPDARLPRDGEQWRVNFSRVEWQFNVVDGKYRRVEGRPEDNWVWSPQGTVNMHRPETWGYVQFTSSSPGSAEYHPDPAGKARHLLHVIYYAEQDYRKVNHRWATSLRELGLTHLNDPSLTGPPRIETTSRLFEAGVEVKRPDGGTERWHIANDGHVWRD